MNEVLTYTEIESRFPSEWVLVEDPVTSNTLQLISGRVSWHSKDRDEVYRMVLELRPKRFAMLYTGRIPENTAIVL